MTYAEVMEHEDEPFLLDCPECGRENEAYLFVDRRDVGSGCTWVVCNECYGPYNEGGMWELEDVADKVRVA